LTNALANLNPLEHEVDGRFWLCATMNSFTLATALDIPPCFAKIFLMHFMVQDLLTYKNSIIF